MQSVDISTLMTTGHSLTDSELAGCSFLSDRFMQQDSKY